MEDLHLHDELSLPGSEKVTIQTKYGSITGGRAKNGAIVFLGTWLPRAASSDSSDTTSAEVPYALPPGRFEDPQPLNESFRYREEPYIREATCASLHP